MPPKKKMKDSKEKTCKTDSKQPILVLDVIRSILEGLSFVDFHRARCVSSQWYCASKSFNGVSNPSNPWLILFPNEYNNKDSFKLFDPHEYKTYTVKDVGFDFATSRCLASSGNWFLMLNNKTEFLLLNLFSRETIPLPSLQPLNATSNKNVIRIGKAFLWVDERSEDYLVVRKLRYSFAYHKKGDDDINSWKVFKPLKNKGCVDMAFKENKLYVLSLSRKITVFDFSNHDDDDDSPIECASFAPPYGKQCCNNLVVTLSGEVLIIASHVEPLGFTLFKMDPQSLNWSINKSIGDEILLLDLGITVAAKDGFMRNCIYFSLSNDENRICVYHIQTDQVFPQSLRLSLPFKNARWFSPTCGSKCLL